MIHANRKKNEMQARLQLDEGVVADVRLVPLAAEQEQELQELIEGIVAFLAREMLEKRKE